MDTTTVLTVISNDTRLDRYIAEQLPELSRAAAQRLIEDGFILVNNLARKASYKVQVGETITVRVPPPEPATPRAENIPLDILYEDDDLIVINKPAGMVVHPAAGHSEGTLVNAILGYMQTPPSPSPLQGEGRGGDAPSPCKGEGRGGDAPSPLQGEGWGGVGGEERPGIVHRLDSETSGIIVVAKNDAAMRGLQAQFKARRVKKTYLALVEGIVQPPSGKIDAPIGRDLKHRQRMAVVTQGKTRASVTVYHTLANLGAHTFLQVEPQTGRTHQIRVHLAFLGFPVVADAVYGRAKNMLGATRQFLHAWKLEFTLPRDQRAVRFTAPLPDELIEVLEKMSFDVANLR
ncbi:MAG: RNA pseudouridine synthase [Chloroflexi bacterium]|nr:RNA pseudouridine synthase [Chloroflexota bacterium]